MGHLGFACMGSKPMYDGNMTICFKCVFSQLLLLEQHQCWAENTSVFDSDTVHDMRPFSMK